MGVPRMFLFAEADVQLDFSGEGGTTVVVGTLFHSLRRETFSLDTQHIWFAP